MHSYEELEKRLDNYIEDNLTYGAFYIDGKWGSGKTFFIKNYIRQRDVDKTLEIDEKNLKKQIKSLQSIIKKYQDDELFQKLTDDVKKIVEKTKDELNDKVNELDSLKKIKDERKKDKQILKKKIKKGEIDVDKIVRYNQFVYVSLNGISDVDSIAYEVLCQIHYKLAAIKNNIVTKLIGRTISSMRPSLNVGNVGIGIEHQKLIKKDEYENFINNNNIKKIVLVFDDLERCKVDTQELLGYINKYVEEKDIKVILIGCEEEIEKYLIHKHKELNMIGSSLLLDPIEFNKNKHPFSVDTDSIKAKQEELQAVEKIIYGKIPYYYKIKEKVVFDTYYFKIDYDYVLESFLRKTVLRGNKENIIAIIKDLLVNFTCTNIRTIKYAFNVLYELLSKLNIDLSKYSDYSIINLYICVFVSAICSKKSINYEDVLKEIESFYDIRDSLVVKFISVKYYNVDGILDFVYYKAFNIDKIKKSMCDIEKYHKQQIPNYFIRLDKYWYDTFKNDEELKTEIETMLTEFQNGNILPRYYHYVYLYYKRFLSIGFNDFYGEDKLKSEIIDAIKKAGNNELQYIDKFYLSPSNEEVLFIDEVNDIISNKISESKAESALNKVVEGCTFAEFEKISHRSSEDKVFLSKVSIDSFMSTIKSADNLILRDIIKLVDKVYSGDYYLIFKSELSYFKNLKVEVQKEFENCSDEKLRKNIFKAFIDIVNRIIEGLSNNDSN